MTAPDLPMQERMLAILNPVGWAQVERLRAAGTPDEEALQVVGHNIETLDRLLTVLAVLSDTAAEAGAKALCLRGDMPGVDEWVCTRHSRVVASAGGLCGEGANEARAVHVATIAAIKEGL